MAVAPFLSASLASTARALLIDFDPLLHSGEHATIDSPPVYEEDGFRLTADTGHASWGTASVHFAGSAALFNDYPDEWTLLDRPDGAPFFLISIDLAELFDDSVAVAVEFVGTRTDSSTIQQSFTLDGLHDGTPGSFETFSFDAGFTDLATLAWAQTSEFHQVDNIRATAIPEPVSALLLGVGLAAVAGQRPAHPGCPRSRR